MPIWLRRWIDALSRLAAGRPIKATLVLILLVALMGEIRLFAPYDWMQQLVTARINQRPYVGDITVVALDTATKERLGRPGLAVPDLARLIAAIDGAGPKQIVIDRVPSFDGRSEDLAPLADKLHELPSKPFMWVELLPSDSLSAREYHRQRSGWAQFEFSSAPISPELRPLVVPVGWVAWSTPFGAPWGVPRTIETADGTFASIPQVLADRSQPITESMLTDLSFDPSSIPTVSAIDILDGRFDPAQVSNRRVLISSSADKIRDYDVSPQGRSTPRAALMVFAAQTLVEGPLLAVGWLPAFLIAVAACLAWLFLPVVKARLTVFVTFVALVISPLLLEPMLIVQETSAAIFLLLFVGIAHLASNIRSALQLARKAAETKSWFLAQASHDLRQPIHAIGMLSARLGQSELNEGQMQLVEKIDRSVEGASRMFQSLLDIATIESGSLKPVLGPVGVDELFSDIEGQNALAAERAGVELRFVPSDLTLLTDRSLALTMVQNLVSNAIKYATGKKVLIGCRRRGSSAMICVYDRGAGISREDLHQVTKAFFRASRRQAGAEGMGLGLAIVHRLAAHMNLRFDMKSNPGRGTGAVISGFRLTETFSQPRQPVQSPAIHLPLTGMRVLLVDDDEGSLKSTEALLEQWGCEVTALDCFEVPDRSYEVLISDFDFGNGQTLTSFGATLNQLIDSGANVVVISGHPPEMVRKTIGRENLLILPKPVRPAELRAVLLSAKVKGSA